MKTLITLCLAIVLDIIPVSHALAGTVRVCPAPAGEELSKDFSVTAA
jgi:hypothetical protein